MLGKAPPNLSGIAFNRAVIVRDKGLGNAGNRVRPR